jgi:hypothetical protein
MHLAMPVLPSKLWMCCQNTTIGRFAGSTNYLGLIVQIKGGPMKKFLIALCSIVLAIGVSGCVGKGPIGKGKAPPPVVTRG